MNPQTLLRLPEVLKRTGFRRTTVYDYVQRGLLTKPVKIGERATAWPDNEISAINAARIAGKSKEAISQLVQTLHAQRQQLTANGEIAQ